MAYIVISIFGSAPSDLIAIVHVFSFFLHMDNITPLCVPCISHKWGFIDCCRWDEKWGLEPVVIVMQLS